MSDENGTSQRARDMRMHLMRVHGYNPILVSDMLDVDAEQAHREDHLLQVEEGAVERTLNHTEPADLHSSLNPTPKMAAAAVQVLAVVDKQLGTYPAGWHERERRQRPKPHLEALFRTWISGLHEADRWMHCGDMHEHDEHRHTVTLNEGNSPGTCVGTPKLVQPVRCGQECVVHRIHLHDGTPVMGDGTPIVPTLEQPVQERSVPSFQEEIRRHLLKEAEATSRWVWYDAIRTHLKDDHHNDAARNLTRAQAAAEHFAEHNFTGGLRGHTEPANLHDFRDPRYVTKPATEESKERARATRSGSQPLPVPQDGVPGAHDLVIEDLREIITKRQAALRRAGQTKEAEAVRLLLKEIEADLISRKALGLARYGSLLQPGNGRDPLRDAYEEVVDLVCYFRQLMAARDEAVHHLVPLKEALNGNGQAVIDRVLYLLAGTGDG